MNPAKFFPNLAFWVAPVHMTRLASTVAPVAPCHFSHARAGGTSHAQVTPSEVRESVTLNDLA
jgi:hypothetical protein